MNPYGYVNDNPSNLIDPQGLWSTEAHEKIIDLALGSCLSKDQLKILKEASGYVDRLAGQLEFRAYQHGMRGGPNQSEAEARNLANNFINEHENLAAMMYRNIRANTIPNVSLREFGMALHTIMDMTSPSHEGFQIWYGPPNPTGLTLIDAYRYGKWLGFVNWHESQETLERLLSDPQHRERAIRDVREAFRKTYGFDCECLK